jgi:hypothetical protein
LGDDQNSPNQDCGNKANNKPRRNVIRGTPPAEYLLQNKQAIQSKKSVVSKIVSWKIIIMSIVM